MYWSLACTVRFSVNLTQVKGTSMLIMKAGRTLVNKSTPEAKTNVDHILPECSISFMVIE